MLLYDAEAWTLLSTDALAFRAFERKVLLKIFGPVRVGDDLRINSELYELLNDIDVVQRINIQRLHWLGHVVRMEEDAPERRVVDAGICGSRQKDDLVSVGRAKSRKPCHGFMGPIDVGAQEAEAPRRMCCARLKSINRVMLN